jgi:hypothetical protein
MIWLPFVKYFANQILCCPIIPTTYEQDLMEAY